MSSAFIKLGCPRSGAPGQHRVSKQLKRLWQQSSGVPWHGAGDSWETKSVCLARIRVVQILPYGHEMRLYWTGRHSLQSLLLCQNDPKSCPIKESSENVVHEGPFLGGLQCHSACGNKEPQGPYFLNKGNMIFALEKNDVT